MQQYIKSPRAAPPPNQEISIKMCYPNQAVC